MKLRVQAISTHTGGTKLLVRYIWYLNLAGKHTKVKSNATTFKNYFVCLEEFGYCTKKLFKSNAPSCTK